MELNSSVLVGNQVVEPKLDFLKNNLKDLNTNHKNKEPVFCSPLVYLYVGELERRFITLAIGSSFLESFTNFCN